MSDPVTIILMGEPVPFARMRLSKAGVHFVPAKQRNTAAALRLEAQRVMQSNCASLFDEPLQMNLHAEFQIPSSWSKRKQLAAIAGEVRPGKRPDIDNLYKLAADALNSVVFRDDALIVDARLRKVYGLQPKLVVTVSSLNGHRVGDK
jgi:Holliday junction resolvase RusA-like endonuclease